MNRKTLAMLVSLFLAAAAWSQEEPAESDEPAETEATTEEAEEIDETGLDEQVYDDVDDDFRPSEEVSTDQSIAFPTDI